MARYTRTITFTCFLAFVLPGGRADEIIRTGGGRISRVTIRSATFEEVQYKDPRVPQTQRLSAEEVEDLIFTGARSLEAGRTLMRQGNWEEALKSFASDYSQPLSSIVVAGDSITDFKMLEAVNQAGGLAIAFNANEYALPHATLSLASTNLSDLKAVLDAWESGGREAAKDVVKEKERLGEAGDRENFHWLEGVKDLTAILETHRRIRRLVREEAAKLG